MAHAPPRPQRRGDSPQVRRTSWLAVTPAAADHDVRPSAPVGARER
ncbi:hypothetical protein [Nocardioides okcheonensis]|nr:hypothetical protein [Nocardioides okcheonensis]UFN43933.1 hypothetical protein LN652_18070 [Nocardioides okcheonensis]